ncbi:hypothetical protein AB1Y20_000693 [Prymnesium parvum]|uniref:EF-hand domain-containing protein n=1 Tax=Prymnesium parvum TaxID=97485 RepID=A0AB34K9A7_PRYPA
MPGVGLARTRQYGRTIGVSEDETPGEQLKRSYQAKTCHEIMVMMALDFRAADVNDDKHLTLREFKSMLPASSQKTLKPEELEAWFSTMDINQDGLISMQEFFIVAMQLAAWRSGAGLTTIFAAYDRDGSGVVNEMEFATAAMGMGFADIASTMFHELDVDGSGTISLLEIINRVRMLSQRRSDCANLRAFLNAMDEQIVEEIDGHSSRPHDGSARDARPPPALGTGQSRRAASSMLMNQVQVAMKEVKDAEGLRAAMSLQLEAVKPMLKRELPSCRKPLRQSDDMAAMLSLFKKWDLNGDGMLGKHEFLVVIKNLAADEEYWRTTLRAIVEEVWDTLEDDDGKADLLRVCRWIENAGPRPVTLAPTHGREKTASLTPCDAVGATSTRPHESFSKPGRTQQQALSRPASAAQLRRPASASCGSMLLDRQAVRQRFVSSRLASPSHGNFQSWLAEISKPAGAAWLSDVAKHVDAQHARESRMLWQDVSMEGKLTRATRSVGNGHNSTSSLNGAQTCSNVSPCPSSLGSSCRSRLSSPMFRPGSSPQLRVQAEGRALRNIVHSAPTHSICLHVKPETEERWRTQAEGRSRTSALGNGAPASNRGLAFYSKIIDQMYAQGHLLEEAEEEPTPARKNYRRPKPLKRASTLRTSTLRTSTSRNSTSRTSTSKRTSKRPARFVTE